jgi:hypothetical protein
VSRSCKFGTTKPSHDCKALVEQSRSLPAHFVITITVTTALLINPKILHMHSSMGWLPHHPPNYAAQLPAPFPAHEYGLAPALPPKLRHPDSIKSYLAVYNKRNLYLNN